MRTERGRRGDARRPTVRLMVGLTATCLLLLGALSARAEPTAVDDKLWAADRFSLGLALEGHLIGAAQGVRPEVLWQPFARDGVTHVVVSAGLLPGREYFFVPINVGARFVWTPSRFFQPALGLGVESQGFFVNDGGPYARLAIYGELGASASLNDVVHVGVMVVPSLAPFGVPGPGVAGRLCLTWDLSP